MHKRVKIPIGVLAAAGASCVAFGVHAGTSTVSVNPSPYATTGCAAIDAQQTSTVPGQDNYLNSEVEPQVAVDPTDPSHLVGVWQQDRWTEPGGNNGEVSAYSVNGGASWTAVPQPFSACYTASGYGPAPNYQRTSDPWVSIGQGKPANACTLGTPDCSTVYSVSLMFDVTDSRTAVASSVSYDGGATWNAPVPIIQDPCSGAAPGYECNPKSFVLNDKESVTADPVHPGTAYVVWDRLQAPPASFPGFFRELAYKGPAYFSKTTDYGQTWSAPQQIVSTPSIDQTIGNIIVVDPNSDTLYNFFTYIQNISSNGGNRGSTIGVVKSADQGATWSAPQTITGDGAFGVSDPNNLDPSTNAAPATLRTGTGLPEPAINPSTGQLYVTWEGADPALSEDVAYITTSDNGGATWSSPAVVNSTTTAPAYTPAIAVGPSGQVDVTFYQWDAATSSGAEPTELFIARSTSGGSSSSAPTFGTQTAISGEFNGLASSWAAGYFLGDYEGLVATSSGYVAFNVLTNCDDGGGGAQPSCRALSSVVNTTSLSPTDNNATDVYAITGS